MWEWERVVVGVVVIAVAVAGARARAVAAAVVDLYCSHTANKHSRLPSSVSAMTSASGCYAAVGCHVNDKSLICISRLNPKTHTLLVLARASSQQNHVQTWQSSGASCYPCFRLMAPALQGSRIYLGLGFRAGI